MKTEKFMHANYDAGLSKERFWQEVAIQSAMLQFSADPALIRTSSDRRAVWQRAFECADVAIAQHGPDTMTGAFHGNA